ncbi:WhiB family transcriptional regulator [Gordonia rubripertincta]|uniref:Transcriptional regulator WhiB n=2 Tax=Gordonia rubripertincta TaxID=36822 RepID=A0AAW4GB13_GORRU|nr:WhiB family transcriptional regulator [Gordonia rubripertincta]
MSDLLAGLPKPPTWHEDAICSQADPDAWFPEKGEATVAAKLICAGCDVREQCLQWALDNGERFGVWGGLSERERREERARRRKAQEESAA